MVNGEQINSLHFLLDNWREGGKALLRENLSLIAKLVISDTSGLTLDSQILLTQAMLSYQLHYDTQTLGVNHH